MRKKKNNVFTIVLLIAIAILLIATIVSVLDFSPKTEKFTYGQMVEAFEKNQVYGYINDPNEFSVIIFLRQEDWANYWDDDSKNDKELYENIKVVNLSSSDYYDFFGSPYNGNYKLKEIENEIKSQLDANGNPVVPGWGNNHEAVEVKETPWYIANLPLIILVVLFVVFLFISFRQANGGKMSGFGKSKARTADQARERVTFADVAGADEEKAELEEVVEYLKNPSKFTGLGAKIPHGVLLVGPPGTGKTLLAKAVAGEAGVPFFSMSGSDFVEMYVGVGASRVRDFFDNARKSRAAIIFIDEIDAVGRQRGAGLGGGHDEREQTLNQHLVEMDGFDGHSGIIVMAATNRPDILDSALLRPGRFDRQITIGLPDIKGREEILKVHAKGKPFEENVDMRKVAQTTVGFTGADLANLLNEAALLAARRSKSLIGMDEIEDAWVKVCVGTQKKNRMTEKEKRNTAIHEAGHAIAAHILPTQDGVRQISIIPSGRALGYTLTPPSEDKYSESKQEMKERIAMMLAGRVAEQLVFGDYTGGASNDIQRATEVARKMVTVYGMSDELGMVYSGSDGDIFVGKNYQERMSYSESQASRIDNEIKKIIDECEKSTTKLLKDNKSKLLTMANVLIEKETIYAEEVDLIMSGKSKEEVVEFINEKDKKKSEENKTEKPVENSENKVNETNADENKEVKSEFKSVDELLKIAEEREKKLEEKQEEVSVSQETAVEEVKEEKTQKNKENNSKNTEKTTTRKKTTTAKKPTTKKTTKKEDKKDE